MRPGTFHYRGLFLIAVLSRVVRAQDPDRSWQDFIREGQHLVTSGNFAAAEQPFEKALHEAERFGKRDWRVAASLEDLGQVYTNEKKFSDAEMSLLRALEIFQETNGIESIEVANVSLDLARLALARGRPADAILLSRRALPVYEKELGPTDLQTASVICLIGDSLRSMKDFTDAEQPLQRCADIRESTAGIESLALADALESLSAAYMAEKKYAQAESRLKLAEKIRENKLGLTNPVVAQTIDAHVAVLKLMGREKEAVRLAALSSAIRRSEKK